MAEVDLTIKVATNQAINSVKKFSATATSSFASVQGSLQGLNLTWVNLSAGLDIASRAFYAGQKILDETVMKYAEFEKAVSEVVTLAPDVEGAFDKIAKSTDMLSREFGTPVQEQVKAYYQAVSAGATLGAQAVDVLTTANKLAIGGVTSVESAVDLLTTSINVYGKEVLSATDASDAIFTAVRLGKTTVNELSSVFGKILPSANALQLSFDEVAGAMASMTAKGISTAESATYLRGLFSSLLRVQARLPKESKDIQSAFDLTGIKAKGLAGFLQNMSEKLGYSNEKTLEMLGSTEALTAVLALSGDGYKSLNNSLNEMRNKAGATQTAHDQMAKQVSFQVAKMKAEWESLFIQIGKLFVPFLRLILDGWSKIFNILNDVKDSMTKLFFTSKEEWAKSWATGNKELDKANNNLQDLIEKQLKIKKELRELRKDQNTWYKSFSIQDLSRLKNLENQEKITQDQIRSERSLIKELKAKNKVVEANGDIIKDKINPALANMDQNLVKTFTKIDNATIESFKKIQDSVENVGLSEKEIVDKTFKDKIETIEKYYTQLGLKEEQANEIIKRLKIQLSDEIAKIDDKANKQKETALESIRKKYKDIGLTQKQIIENNRKEEIAKLDELKGYAGTNEAELADLRKKINDNFNKEAIETNKKTNNTIIKATEARFGQAGSYISTFLSSGAKGLIQSAITAVGDKYLPGLGQALGQLFELFTMSTEKFREKLKELFSPEFIKSLGRNIEVALKDLPALTEGLIKGTAEAVPGIIMALAKAFGPEFIWNITKSVMKGVVDGLKNAWKGGIADEALMSQLDTELKTIADKRIDIEKQIADETEKIARDANNSIRTSMLERQTEITNSLKTIASRKKEIEKEMNDISVQEAMTAINKKKELATAQFANELELLKQTTAKSTEIYNKAVDDRITKEKKYEDLLKEKANAKLSEQEKALGEQTRDQKALLDLAISDEKAHQSKIDQLKYDAIIAKENNDLLALQSTNDLIDAEQLLYDEALARRLTLEDEYNAQVKQKKEELKIVEEISLQDQIDNAKKALDEAIEQEKNALATNNENKRKELIKQSIWEIAQNKTTVQEVLKENKTALGDEETAVKTLVQESIKLRNSMTPMIVEATDKSTLLQNELNTITQEATKLEAEAKKMIVPALQEGLTKVQELQAELEKLAQDEIEVKIKVKSEQDRVDADKGIWGTLKDDPLGNPITTVLTGGLNKVVDSEPVKKITKFLGFETGGLVPEGYPEDSFPASLTSGELVIPRNDVTDLRDFLNREKSQTNMNTQNQTQAKNLTVNLNVGEANLAKVLLNLNRQGFRTV